MDGRRCILIAEDHPDAREMLATLLRAQGYPVLLAVDGEEALALSERERPDLAILDMMMPGLDGLEVCRAIKEMAGDDFLPVMILTALGRHESKIAGLDGGADDYVTKPFNPPELLARIRALLRIKRVHEQLAEKDRELVALNRELELRVREQVLEIERVNRLKRYLAPGMVESVLRGDNEDPLRAPRRKDLTILFSDIRDFTTMSDLIDPEDVRTVLEQYLEEMGQAVFRHGGTINKFLGDGLMVVFNDPEEQPDHALRAIHAALDMRERAMALQARFHSILPEPFNVGIGIHSGPATVGPIGRNGQLDYTAIGPSVNLASRLQALARHNQIVISSHTYDAHRPLLKLLYERREAIKGFAHPVRVAELIGLAEVRQSGTG